MGCGAPYLEQHKESEKRQEAAAAACPLGQVPHHGADADPEGRWCQRAPPVAAHKGELGLQPQTLGAEDVPGGLMLPFQSPCACSPSCFAPRVLQECARRCCSLTAKDGEGGDWSGRGSAAAATAAARGGSGDPRGEREAGTLRPARRGPLAAGIFSSGLRTHEVTAVSRPFHQSAPAVSDRWTAPLQAPPQPFPVSGTQEFCGVSPTLLE